MTRVRRFLRLSPEERVLVLRAGVALAAVRVLSALLPHSRVRAITGGGHASGAGIPGVPRVVAHRARPAPREIGRAVERAATVVPGATCLVQALAAEWLIRRAAGEAVVRIGVAREGGGLAAHAWVESAGEIVLGGAEAARYAALEGPGAPGPQGSLAPQGPTGSRGPAASRGEILLPGHAALLLLLARFPLGDADRAEVEGLVASGPDWTALLTGAERHGLVPLAHHNLATLTPGRVPPEVLFALRTDADDAARTALHLTGRLIQAMDALEGAGVSAIPFKGPALDRRLYGERGLRAFGDLDLLVRPAESRAAVEALEALGYRVEAASTEHRGAVLARDSVVSLARDGDAPVEIHRGLVHPVHAGRLDFEGMWERAGTASLGGRRIPELHAHDLLFLLSLHGAKHGWERLGWIADVARLVQVEVAWDWDAVLERARFLGMGRIVRTGLAVAHELLGALLPPEVEGALAADREVEAIAGLVRRHVDGPAPGGRYVARFHWGVSEGWVGRAAMVGRTLFGLTPADWETVRVPRGLGWVRYPLRPLRLAREYLLTPRRA